LIARRHRVPLHILASIKAKKPELLAKAYKTAVQREYYDLVSAASKKITLLGRVQTFKAERIKTENGGDRVRLTLKFPTTAVIWYMDIEEFAKHSAEEWIRMLTDWIFVKAELVEYKLKRGNKRQKIRFWEAKKVVFAKVEEDVETAKRLIEAYVGVHKHPTIVALGGLLGYATKAVMESLEMQTLVTLYTLPIVAADPIHALILTRPGMGKTTIAFLYRDMLKWEYYAEIPSIATLIGDARTGRSRVAGVNGIWFDEVDKWVARRAKTDAVAELVEVILTGMEQGIWKRSRGGEKTIEVHNPIPVVLSGNVGSAVDPREKIRQIVGKVSGDAANAFEERIAYAVVVAAKWSGTVMKSTWESVTKYQLITRPSVMRGMRTLLQELYALAPEPSEVPSEFEGRYARSFKRVFKALNVLLSPNPLKREWPDEGIITEFAKRLVGGWVVTDTTAGA